jgi:hypothetical protein
MPKKRATETLKKRMKSLALLRRKERAQPKDYNNETLDDRISVTETQIKNTEYDFANKTLNRNILEIKLKNLKQRLSSLIKERDEQAEQ